MSRLPDFKTDNDVYGKVGEHLFESYSHENKLNFIDVRENKDYQALDIDYIWPFKSEYTAKQILNENLFTKYSKHSDNWVSVEVKTDTRTHGTRNLVYEMISHDNPGCLARSVADFIFYVAIDEKTKKVYEAWLVNLKKWRKWIREKSPKLNPKNKEGVKFPEQNIKIPIKLHNFDTYGDACLNFLCNVDELVKEGIAAKINLKKYENRT